jgi:hypothetical protein
MHTPITSDTTTNHPTTTRLRTTTLGGRTSAQPLRQHQEGRASAAPPLRSTPTMGYCAYQLLLRTTTLGGHASAQLLLPLPPTPGGTHICRTTTTNQGHLRRDAAHAAAGLHTHHITYLLPGFSLFPEDWYTLGTSRFTIITVVSRSYVWPFHFFSRHARFLFFSGPHMMSPKLPQGMVGRRIISGNLSQN